MRCALLIGWAAGTAIGTYMAATQGFVSSVYPLEIFGVTLPGYAALYSVVINFLRRRRAVASVRSHGAASRRPSPRVESLGKAP